jgi:hypothetical protein
VPNPRIVSAEQAIEDIIHAEYLFPDLSFDINDPLQMKKGTRVKVEQTE